ncbi:MAG: hypothetical protein Q7R87_04895 [Nanoarchaeota archaeon]|nr:hypothetical protein [Nanoarchaeota archaeon]
MKDKVKSLRVNGFSYSEIAKKIGKSRKFAWKHGKGIKFSESGEKRYKDKVKGIILQIKPQSLGLSIEKARIISHIFFDGTIFKSNYHSIVRYINSSKELINQFIDDVKKVYGLNNPIIETFSQCKVPYYKVAFSSKKMYEDLLKYIPLNINKKDLLPIPSEILNGDRDIKLVFLSSFFTDEGSISKDGRITGDLKNEKMIRQIILILEEFGLPFRICKYEEKNGPIFKIYLPKKIEYLEIFQHLKLFDKSIITHGKNINKKKQDILKLTLERLKNPL